MSRKQSAAAALMDSPMRVAPWSDAQKKEFLNARKVRAQHFLVGNIAQEVCTALEGSIAKYEEARAAFTDLCARADGGDREAAQEMQELRIWSVQNFLLAGANYTSFFEIENLGEGDVPYIENTTRHEAHVAFVGQDGGEPRWQPVLNWQKSPVPAFWLTTEEFEYPLVDVYTGRISDRAKANVDMAFDMNMKLDSILYGYLHALIGSFTNSGNLASRVFVPHSRINVDNLPTTNLLVPSDNSSSTLFRKSCMDAIMAYAKAWGDNAFADGPLRPTAVFVPSAHITGFLDEVDVTNPHNLYNAQVFDFGIIMDYAGQKWAFIADPTLDPAAGRALVKFNKPIGKLWTKTDLDVVIVDDSKAMQKQNLESVLERKPFFAGLPNQARINIAEVQYRTV